MASKETKTKREKQRNQVKSRFYYIFWGAATLSVFAGQYYVGSGYRRMSEAVERITNGIIVVPIKVKERADPWEEQHPMMLPRIPEHIW
tara:strand:- start:41 stop:307 length:267 start_codon:yes stop_codon:yes gene_type:complete